MKEQKHIYWHLWTLRTTFDLSWKSYLPPGDISLKQSSTLSSSCLGDSCNLNLLLKPQKCFMDFENLTQLFICIWLSTFICINSWTVSLLPESCSLDWVRVEPRCIVRTNPFSVCNGVGQGYNLTQTDVEDAMMENRYGTFVTMI